MICPCWLAHMFSSCLNLVTDGCGHNWPPCTGLVFFLFFFGISLELSVEGGLKSAAVWGGRKGGIGRGSEGDLLISNGGGRGGGSFDKAYTVFIFLSFLSPAKPIW